jgi:hypothetical protein
LPRSAPSPPRPACPHDGRQAERRTRTAGGSASGCGRTSAMARLTVDSCRPMSAATSPSTSGCSGAEPAKSRCARMMLDVTACSVARRCSSASTSHFAGAPGGERGPSAGSSRSLRRNASSFMATTTSRRSPRSSGSSRGGSSAARRRAAMGRACTWAASYVPQRRAEGLRDAFERPTGERGEVLARESDREGVVTKAAPPGCRRKRSAGPSRRCRRSRLWTREDALDDRDVRNAGLSGDLLDRRVEGRCRREQRGWGSGEIVEVSSPRSVKLRAPRCHVGSSMHGFSATSPPPAPQLDARHLQHVQKSRVRWPRHGR